MRQGWFGRIERDHELGEALRRLEAGTPAGDDDVLRARVTLAAESALRDLRVRSLGQDAAPWWEWTSRLARLAVPAGAAVALASALLVARTGVPATLVSVAAADTLTVSGLLVSAGAAEAGGTELALDGLLAPAEPGWLFTEAMGR
jgi:hypothetical protein